MPRTSAVECPGCPPIRALTTDELGLVKVIEAHGKASVPKVVETWGSPDASLHILLASMDDSKINPLLAIARKNGLIELCNPLNGNVLISDKVENAFPSGTSESPLSMLHLFRSTRSEPSSNKLIMCTEKGKACLRSIRVDRGSKKAATFKSDKVWDVCSSGTILCSSVDRSEKYALFAGKGIEVNVWDLDLCSKIWTAKYPRSNSLNIYSPTWFTCATFISKEDHRKIITGTNNHQVRLYDISAQRRPVISVDFRESPIRTVAEDFDSYTVYVGTTRGDLASIDMRTGKLLGCFVGKCSGSIRSIVRHPQLPVLASCGLDRYLRFWDTKTRQLLSAVFLKQILTNVVLDSHFSDEDVRPSGDTSGMPILLEECQEKSDELKQSERPVSIHKHKNVKRKKSKIVADINEDDTSTLPPERPAQEKKLRKQKHKKRKESSGPIP